MPEPSRPSSPNKRICLISQSHLSRNPRVVKEAISLAKAGYQVIIVTSIYAKDLFAQDRELVKNYDISIKTVANLDKRSLQTLIDKLLLKLGVWANAYLKLSNKFTLGYGVHRYVSICLQQQADLYLCHQELATYIGTQLLKRGLKVGFDFEDWYSEDLLPTARKTRSLQLLKAMEKQALQQGTFSYTTSDALAKVLCEHYNCKMPYTLYNVFPQPNIDNHTSIEPKPHLNLFWFSQTIGEGRGLEEFIALLNQLQTKVALHLLGDVSSYFSQKLERLLAKPHQLFFHPLVPPSQLPAKIATFDIGLALEKTTPPSRNYTITNKFFQYIQSGLPIIASATAGQLEIFEKGSPGLLLSAAPEMAKDLDHWLSDVTAMNHAKAKALQLASIYNWENEEKKLLHMIKQHME